ncbi:hypothetical protein GW17_00032398, partial [Ensete ventricosum]
WENATRVSVRCRKHPNPSIPGSEVWRRGEPCGGGGECRLSVAFPSPQTRRSAGDIAITPHQAIVAVQSFIRKRGPNPSSNIGRNRSGPHANMDGTKFKRPSPPHTKIT